MTADDARAGSGLRSRELAVAAALALAVVVATAAFPMIVDARAAYEIPVEQQAGAGDLAEPTGDAWESVETVSVPLSSSSGAAVPGGTETTVESASVAAARTDERLYLRMSWSDGTANTSTDSLREFADAAAVQLPVSSEERPPIAMGSTDNRVNVWYWNGADGTESLLARRRRQHDTDPGVDGGDERDTHRRPMDRRVQPAARVRPRERDRHRRRRGHERRVRGLGRVERRALRPEGGQRVVLPLARPERGRGAVRDGAVGIAGIAVVFTTLVTVEGVRRTRGE